VAYNRAEHFASEATDCGPTAGVLVALVVEIFLFVAIS
jgi:hypothetical protein